jgi:hypothetical protein
MSIPRRPSLSGARENHRARRRTIENWHDELRGDPVAWLLEEDNPSVRYFALRDILQLPHDDPELLDGQSAIMASKPVSDILAAQYPQGHWIKPDRGYSPKYRATVWQLMFLTQLGATRTEAVDRGCRTVLEHSYLPEEGLFSATKSGTGAIICLNGNLLHALRHFGYGDHQTARTVTEALAAHIGTEGYKCRGNASDRSKEETWLPCVWGAIKALRAFAVIPAPDRSEAVNRAVDQGVDCLLSRDLMGAEYPSATAKVSPLWFRFGFPLAYHSDVLEALDVLAQLGHSTEPSLLKAIEFVLENQDDQGRWPSEHTLHKTWTRFGRKGQPSKWVTLRALRMLAKLS